MLEYLQEFFVFAWLVGLSPGSWEENQYSSLRLLKSQMKTNQESDFALSELLSIR